MPAEIQEKYTYYKINKEGKIECTSKGPHKGQEFDLIWGQLIDIELKQDEWEGKKYFNYMLHLLNPLDSSTEILQVREGSSASRGIMMSLFCIDGPIRQVRFKPYRNTQDDNTYTNMSLMCRSRTEDDWQKIPEWPPYLTDNMPAQRETKLPSGEIHLDDIERNIYIRKLFVRIKKTKLSGADHLKAPVTGGLSGGERVDPATGEVVRDGRQVADDLYNQPDPALPPPPADADLPADFDDMDDNLPF